MRILFYSPDSYGLGHVRRTTLLARSLLAGLPGSSALLLTGAPRAHYFRYPPRCDYVKLPSVTKSSNGRYVCREIDLSLDETIRLRGRLIEEAAAAFGPEVMVVDHAPLGLCGEVLPALRQLRRRRRGSLRVLGMRDVIDEPAAVLAAWRRDGVLQVLRGHYDLILVYGQRDVFDVTRRYAFPDDVAGKVRFVGYVAREAGGGSREALLEDYAPRTGRLVTVTVGGGGDGNLLVRRFLDGYASLGSRPPFEVLVVTGPLMSPGKRKRFQALAARLDGLTLTEYSDELPDVLEVSDFVVSMGGYNSVCELARAGARALIVPRSFPRREQHLRARLLADRGVVRFAELEHTTSGSLMQEVLRGLERERPPRGWGLDFGGPQRVVEVLGTEVQSRRESAGRREALGAKEAAR